MRHRMAVVRRHAVDALALRKQLVPIRRVRVEAVFDRAAAVPDLHGEVAVQRLELARGHAAPLRVAVDRHVAVRVQHVDHLLALRRRADARRLEALILSKAVALAMLRADGDDEEYEHP